MSVLHELLPVRDELKGERKKLVEEAQTTFDKKAALFMGQQRDFSPFDEALKAQEATSERKELDTTVRAKLDYLFNHLTRYMDVALQVDATNMTAVADIVIDGKVLARSVPATFLLTLESELRDLRTMANAIPTLAPGKAYEKDATLGPNVWRQVNPEESFRTNKVIMHKILVQPTKEHPAQVEKWTETVNVGKYVTHAWFGSMSSAEKSELLGRIDALSRAVKEARQRANGTTVCHVTIGQALRDFILDGKV